MLICLLKLNMIMSIAKVTGVSFENPKDYATKSQTDATLN